MVHVSPGRAAAVNSTVSVDTTTWRVTETARYGVDTRDMYGNTVDLGGESVSMQASGPRVLDADITDFGNGSYVGVIPDLAAGNFTVTP